jgi:hypothetical protein
MIDERPKPGMNPYPLAFAISAWLWMALGYVVWVIA